MAAPESSVITYIQNNEIEEAAKLLNQIEEPRRTETFQSLYSSVDLTPTQKQRIFDVILALGRIDEGPEPILTRTGNRVNNDDDDTLEQGGRKKSHRKTRRGGKKHKRASRRVKY